MADTAQTYQTHRKFVPAVPLRGAADSARQRRLRHLRASSARRAVDSLWALAMAVALFLGALFGRVFALAAQDRVIRLEERLRLRELLAEPLRSRIHEFTRDQLIALRFASDAELPELAATVLRDNVQKRDDIKKMVKNWRADTHQL